MTSAKDVGEVVRRTFGIIDAMVAGLVTPRLRPLTVLVASAGAAVVIALGAWVFHGHSTRFDDYVLRVLAAHLGHGWMQGTLAASTPGISVVLLVVVLTAAAWRRRFDLAVLCVLGPAVAVGLAQYVLKPLIGRTLGVGDIAGKSSAAVPAAFPSGHETLVAATALVLFVAACQLPVRRWALIAIAAVLAVWVVAAAAGLVVNYWHYATDTIGAVGLCCAVVLGGAVLIDRVAPFADAQVRRRRGALTVS